MAQNGPNMPKVRSKSAPNTAQNMAKIWRISPNSRVKTESPNEQRPVEADEVVQKRVAVEVGCLADRDAAGRQRGGLACPSPFKPAIKYKRIELN